MNPHGTLERYDEGCRCSACVFAAAATDDTMRREAVLAGSRRGGEAYRARHGRGLVLQRRQVSSHTLTTGELAVDCWCRAAVVYVDPEVVRACRTGSCGLPGCVPELVDA